MSSLLRVREASQPLVLFLAGVVPLLLSGLVVQQFGAPTWATRVAFFALFNLAIVWRLSIPDYFSTWWSLRTLFRFVPGALLGLTVAGLPIFIDETQPHFILPSIGVLGGVFLQTTYEELWFRGAAFEFAVRRHSLPTALSMNACVFALAHMMNLDYWTLDVVVFFIVAGYAIALSCLVFRSFWAPVGFHFAHNALLTAHVEPSGEPAVTMAGLATVVAVALALSAVVARRQGTRRPNTEGG